MRPEPSRRLLDLDDRSDDQMPDFSPMNPVVESPIARQSSPDEPPTRALSASHSVLDANGRILMRLHSGSDSGSSVHMKSELMNFEECGFFS